MSGGLSQCAHVDILEGYPNHDSWSGYFFYSKGHLSGVALKNIGGYVVKIEILGIGGIE